MRRRGFIAGMGAAVAWPIGARGQNKSTVIGFLVGSSASATNQWTNAFEKRLRELDWVQGKNLEVHYRFADGRTERYSEIASEFVRIKVAIIVTAGTEPVIAAKQLTTTIPIVFATAGDPVGSGLVATLARPGGNVTGLSNQQSDLAGERLELLREIVPRLRRVAIMGNYRNPAAVSELQDVEAAASMMRLQVVKSEVQTTKDIDLAFETVKTANALGLEIPDRLLALADEVIE